MNDYDNHLDKLEKMFLYANVLHNKFFAMEALKEKDNGENNVQFSDILLERRCTSDLLWASRDWNPKSAYIQPHKTSATQIKSIVLNSYRLRQVINEISKEENVEPEDLYRRVQNILDEMSYNREVPILRWLGLFTAKILKKLCSAILVNEKQLLKIKSEMGKNPVLFVPSHRSYGDFILMSYICFHYDLDIPRIAAGMDFHGMAIMGKILKDSCAFFMRRSFNNDKLYTAIFSQYVQTLVTDGDASLEFFIEGTRSRTSKSLMPKFGFLSMALKPFLTGLVPDISVVPVNLSYDRTLEEVLFAYELLGVPKPKESTKGFLKALSILNENYGNIYVRFGESFSVKDYFGREIDRSLHSFGPVQLQDLTLSETKQIIRLAHAIVDKQRELTVITCFNLVAAVLNNNIVNGKEPFTLENLVGEVSWLSSVLKRIGVVVAVNDISEESVVHAVELHKNLVAVSSSKHIKLCRIHSNGTPVDPSKLKGYHLADSTMDVAVPLVMIQNYVNPCAHFLINLSIIALVMECRSQNTVIDKDDLFQQFLFLRSIFSYEFVFYEGSGSEDFQNACKLSEELKLTSTTGEKTVAPGVNHKLRKFCINIFASFVPSYIVVAENLLKNHETDRSEADIVKSCQKEMEINLSKGKIAHPNNLSLDVLSNALQTFTSLGLISKSKGNGKVRYSVRGYRLASFHAVFSSFDVFKSTVLDFSELFLTFISGKL